jgi:hypothetical protein
MALPLKDFRLGITESIDLWLDADAIAFDKDKAAIAREVLAEWAKKKAHAFKVAHRRMAGNGLQPELFGDDTEEDGSDREPTGISRKR